MYNLDAEYELSISTNYTGDIETYLETLFIDSFEQNYNLIAQVNITQNQKRSVSYKANVAIRNTTDAQKLITITDNINANTRQFLQQYSMI